MSTNTDDAEKRIDRQSDNLGSRRSQLPGVDGAFLSVETPGVHDRQSVAVSGYCYDDERGDVEIVVGDDVRVAVTLAPSTARALAEQLDAAAAEATAEIENIDE